MRAEIVVFVLAFCVLVVLNNWTECGPLTFSTDWSGGRRELGGNDEAELLNANTDINLDKRRPGWGKRAPGWGKRSETETTQLRARLVNLYNEYERKADELRKMIHLLDAEK